MKLYRAVKTNPPSDLDFASAWDRGRRPPKRRPDLERTFKAVSTYRTLERARATAVEYDLGAFIAELEVESFVRRIEGGHGHVDLEGTTPAELMNYVIAVHPVGSEGRVRKP